MLTVIGFGHTTHSGTLADTLQKARVPVVDDTICAERYPTQVDIVTSFCAGEAGIGSCVGDSGSPIIDMQTQQQVRIVSGGIGCTQPDFPAFYTVVVGLGSSHLG